VVEGGEELRDVEGEDASQQISNPSSANKMGESDTCISCGFELETAKLTVMNEIIGDHVKLESITDDFFDEFT